MQDGNVWEKAGVNVSVVYGTMPADAYRAATGSGKVISNDAGRVPFFAAGISSVMHPKNPHAPTMHFNYRYFETEEWNGLPKVCRQAARPGTAGGPGLSMPQGARWCRAWCMCACGL